MAESLADSGEPRERPARAPRRPRARGRGRRAGGPEPSLAGRRRTRPRPGPGGRKGRGGRRPARGPRAACAAGAPPSGATAPQMAKAATATRATGSRAGRGRPAVQRRRPRRTVRHPRASGPAPAPAPAQAEGEVAERHAGEVGHARPEGRVPPRRAVPARGPPDLSEGDPARGHAAEGPELADPLGQREQRRESRHPGPSARGEGAGEGEDGRLEDDEGAVAEKRELVRPGEADDELPDPGQQTRPPPVRPGDRPIDSPREKRRPRRRRAATSPNGGSESATRTPAGERRENPELPSSRRVMRLGDREPPSPARSPLVRQAGIPIPPSDGPASSSAGSSRRAATARSILRKVPGEVLGKGPGPALDAGWQAVGRRAPSSSLSSPSTVSDELLVGHRRGPLVAVAPGRGTDDDLARRRRVGPLGGEEGAAGDEPPLAARDEETAPRRESADRRRRPRRVSRARRSSGGSSRARPPLRGRSSTSRRAAT